MAEQRGSTPPSRSGLPGRLRALVERVQRWKPVRVWSAYSARRGPILAAGLAYQTLFAGFAALWAAFSIAGVIVAGDLDLREEVLELLKDAVPGLIQDTAGGGALDPELLLSAGVYGVSGAVAIVGLVITALGWPATAGDSVRAVLGLPPSRTNAVLLKLRDLGFGIGLGLMLALSAALALAATSASGIVLGWLGIDARSGAGVIAGRAASLLAILLIEAAVLTGVYRVLAGARLPGRVLRDGLLLGTAGLGALTIGGSLLLGSAGGNPLIASFAVVAGLLVFFNLAGQVILLAAAWMAVSAEDMGVELDARPPGDAPAASPGVAPRR